MSWMEGNFLCRYTVYNQICSVLIPSPGLSRIELITFSLVMAHHLVIIKVFAKYELLHIPVYCFGISQFQYEKQKLKLKIMDIFISEC